ncbi:MAG: response regulator, partial [Verrucomicrobia bacterium]|nr:response regulator [Verrucomicrobiota bacterium]
MSATSTEIHTRKRVLFVDDEQPLLDLVAPTMEAYSGGLWDVVTASTTTKALAELQERTIHLIVVDIHMPVVDGIQFLKLLQKKYPSVPRAVLTGDASDERRDACSANGAELFLEKPRSPDGWEIVYAMLNELAKTQQETGFQGVLRRVGIEDVLQMECLARHSLVLEIQGTAESGRVFIHQGSIIHASCKDLKGEAAFNRLLGLRGGQFNLKPFTEPDERTIVGSWEFLLMEAARMKDE